LARRSTPKNDLLSSQELTYLNSSL